MLSISYPCCQKIKKISSLLPWPSLAPPRAHPCLQYGEIQRVCKDLPPATLRQALLVLIQHNYVACYLRQEAPTLRGPGPQYQLYEAALPRILQILR